MEERKNLEVCPKCHGLGRIMRADGSVTTCFDCLQNGRFDVHAKEVKESKIRV